MSGPFGSSNFFSGTTVAAAYTIDNSCIFNGTTDDPRLEKTLGSDGNLRTWTLSFWFKRAGKDGTFNTLLRSGTTDSDTTYERLQISSDTISFQDESVEILTTTQKIRDFSAWYHFCLVWDTTNSTSGERVRMYLNGLIITDFSTANYPSLNTDSIMSDASFPLYIGKNSVAEPRNLDGYLAEWIFIDGSALTASSFGEFNSDGVWIPTDPSTLTFGTAGYWLDFEDSSDLGNDVSGNNNDFTSTGLTASDQTLDTPTDSGTTIGNLATWNPLDIQGTTDWGVRSLSEGNTVYTTSSGSSYALGNIGMQSGKFYWRVQATTFQGSGYPAIGVVNQNAPLYDGGWIGGDTNAWCILTEGASNTGKTRTNGTTSASSLFTVSAGDYIDIALDVDNLKMWFGLNGTFDGDPAAGTGEAFTVNGTHFFASAATASTSVATIDCEGGTPPAGFSRYGTMGIAAPTITKPTDNFLPIAVSYTHLTLPTNREV